MPRTSIPDREPEPVEEDEIEAADPAQSAAKSPVAAIRFPPTRSNRPFP